MHKQLEGMEMGMCIVDVYRGMEMSRIRLRDKRGNEELRKWLGSWNCAIWNDSKEIFERRYVDD